MDDEVCNSGSSWKLGVGIKEVVFRGSHAIMDEIFQASKARIIQMNKGGIVQGRPGIAEPDRQHLPVLTNMENYEYWVNEAASYVMDKRLLRKKQEHLYGREIEIENIFQDVSTNNGRIKKCSHVMVLGAAGMGKTTLLRRMALYCGEGMLKGKLVIVLEFRTLPLDQKMHPSEVLLANIFSDCNSERMKQRYEWIIDNADKIVFVIDSLDTLPFDLDNERRCIEYHTPATVDVILHNLLARNLFPKSLIISSSREYKVKNLHPSVRPDRCVLLDGLKENSVKDLINGFLGEDKGAEIKEHINTECPDIWPILSIPVVLVFSMIGFAQDGFKPKTLSGILIKFLSCLIRSSHVHAKDIRTVFRKLMRLSCDGIRRECVLFTREYLKQFRLEPEEVTGLGILIPQSHGTFVSTKLMQNDRYFLYFNHQTEQEAFAALHILSLSLVEFETVIKWEIWRIQFTVVRRVICGTLLNVEVLEAAQELTEISDVDQKKKILIQSLAVTLAKYVQREVKTKLLELFIDLSECREGVTELIRSSVKKIDFSDISLSPSDVQVVAFVIKQCEYLQKVILGSCNLDGQKMKIFARMIMQSNVKFDKFDVKCNRHLGVKGAHLLGKLVKNHGVKSLDASHASIRGCKSLKKFIEGLGDAKFEEFDICGMHLDPEEAHLVGKLVKNHEIKSLDADESLLLQEEKFIEGLMFAQIDYLSVDSIYPCGLGPMLDLLPHIGKNLYYFSSSSESEQLRIQQRLNEIGSPSLMVNGVTAKLEASPMDSTSEVDQRKKLISRSLGIALEKYQRQRDKRNLLELFVDLSECNENVTELIRSSVKKIDLFNTSLSPSEVQVVAFVMKQCEYLEEVCLQHCNVNYEKMKILASTIKQSNVKIEEFDVSDNKELGSQGAHFLGKLVKNHDVKRLSAGYGSLQGCEVLLKLMEGLGDAKLEEFGIRGNWELSPEYARLLGNLVKNHEVKSLNASNANIQGCESVEKFLEGLGDAKIDYLDLRDTSMPPYARSLLDLLPHVEKELNLRDWKINEGQQQELQQRLTEIDSPLLKVVIGKLMNPTVLKASQKDSTSEVSTTSYENDNESDSIASIGENNDEWESMITDGSSAATTEVSTTPYTDVYESESMMSGNSNDEWESIITDESDAAEAATTETSGEASTSGTGGISFASQQSGDETKPDSATSVKADDDCEAVETVSDVNQKKHTQIRNLAVALEKYQHHRDKKKLLKLFVDLSECRENVAEIIRSSVKKIDFYLYTSLSPSEVQAIALVMKQCDYLGEVNLQRCNLNGDKMKILTRTIMHSNVKIEEFVVSSNKKLGPQGAHFLGKLVKNHDVKRLTACYGSLQGCEVLMKLIEGLGDAKFEEFDICGMHLDPEEAHLVGKLVKNHEVKSLAVDESLLGCEQVQKFIKGLMFTQIDYLSLDCDYPICSLGKILDLLPHVEKQIEGVGMLVESEQQQLQQKLNEIGSPSLVVNVGSRKFTAEPEASLMDSTLISDVDQKKKILIQSLGVTIEKYQRQRDKTKLLKLFVDLSECKESVTELIRSSVKKINFSYTSLSPSEVQAVAFVMKQCKYLEEVYLQRCNLNGEKMKILTRTIMHSNVKLEEFDVSNNNDLGPEGANFLGKLVKNHDVKRLIAGHGSLRGCEVLMKLTEGLGDAKLEEFGIRGNWKLGPKYARLLGKLVKNHGVKSLNASNANIRGCKSVKGFIKGLGDAKIDYLDLRDSNMPAYTSSLLDLLPHVEKEFNLRDWKVNKRQQQKLQQRLNEIDSPLFNVIIGGLMNPTVLKASQMDSTSEISDEISTSGTSFVSPRETSFASEQTKDETNLESTTPGNEYADRKATETAARISAKIERLIKTESTKSKVIGTKGDFIVNFGSKVTFSNGAYDKETEVQTSLFTNFSDCPKDRVPIAPSIKCSPSGKLNKPALVEIDHWAFPSGNHFYVDVYRKDDEDSERRFFKKIRVEVNRKISFYTEHFTIYEFLVKCAESAWSTILRPFFLVNIQNHVYINGVDQSIVCVCCLKDDKVKNDVIQTLASEGFIRLLPLPETTQADRKEQVKIQIECLLPENLKILPDIGSQGKMHEDKKFERNLSVNEVLSNSYELFSLQLGLRTGDLRKYEGMLRFKYSQTSEKKDKSHTLQKKWPLQQQAATHPVDVQHQSNIHITAGKLNIGGQMTTSEIGTASRTMGMSGLEQSRSLFPDSHPFISGGAETGNKLSEQICRQRGGTSSNVTAGTYNAGEMTSNQYDTTTQVFGK